MPDIASIMKAEILRLARKEVKNVIAGVKKASVGYRSEIAHLKRRVESLEKQLSRIEKKSSPKFESIEPSEEATQIRFSAKRLAAQRQKLGFSAAEMGALLSVSAQTIYNWEAEKSRPRQAQLVAIAALRGLGKRRAKAKLEELVNHGTGVS